jgi:hypothetical protein
LTVIGTNPGHCSIALLLSSPLQLYWIERLKNLGRGFIFLHLVVKMQ